MAASRLLGAAAAIVLEWLHQGCDSDLSADFSNLALVIFLLKFLLKSASKSCFFWLRCRDPSGFGAAIPIVIMCKKASLCKNFFLQKLAVCQSFCVKACCV